MYIIFFLVLSPLFGIISSKVNSKFNIPVILVLITIGIFLNSSGIFNFLNKKQIEIATNSYSSVISMGLVFVMAGFNINLDLIKKKLRTMMMISIIPPILVIALVFPISLLYFKVSNFNTIFGINNNFNAYGTFVFAFMLAVSAPVLVIPSVIKLNKKYKEIGSTMLAGLMIDNYTLLPLVFCVAIIGIITNGSNGNLAFPSLLLLIIGVIVTMALMGVLGFSLGFIINKHFTLKLPPIVRTVIYSILCITIMIIMRSLPAIGDILSPFGLIFDILYGFGLRCSFPPEKRPIISLILQKLVLYFAFPIMFLGLGERVGLHNFLNFKLLGFIVLIFLINRSLKYFIVYQILKKEGYGKEEKKIGSTLTIFDGAGPINLSIALTPILLKMGQESIIVLATLYGILTFVTTLIYGETVLSSYCSPSQKSKEQK
ncbi:cation:proton antiporter [Lactococcus garvieae]|uniref:hypothetical protein n=1 Tax=Lactococcus garvieae TaxID=1363 RepID=UPI003852F7FD